MPSPTAITVGQWDQRSVEFFISELAMGGLETSMYLYFLMFSMLAQSLL